MEQIAYDGYTSSENKKIPTSLLYKENELDKGPLTWGFEANEMAKKQPTLIHAFAFKRMFNTQSTNETDASGRLLPPVHTLYLDYLAKLYQHLQGCLTERIVRSGKTWETLRIDFNFSYPTTWEPIHQGQFITLIKTAGFDRCDNHKVHCTYTEGQAVVAYEMSRVKDKKFEVSCHPFIVHQR